MTHIFYNVAPKVCVLFSLSLSHKYSMCRAERQMRSALATRVPNDGMARVLDMNAWMARKTLEMLGQAGLGYSFDSFVEDSSDPFGESLKMFLYVTSSVPWTVRTLTRLINMAAQPCVQPISEIRLPYRATLIPLLRRDPLPAPQADV